MKKVLFGFLMGAIMMASLPVMANSFIGKTVETTFPVYLYGDKLVKDAIVIDSTSYLPVRVLGDVLNLDVKFENGQVLLERKQNMYGKKDLNYKVRSNILTISSENPSTPSFEENGETYVSSGVFEKSYTEKLYKEGRLHLFDGRMFMRLSDFGLKAVIKDGIMWLE